MKKGILLHEPDDDVGVAAMDLKAGEQIQAVTLEGEPVTPMTGYRRQNGRVGTRNHVVILPVDDISNAAAEGVAR
jgi:hypothetical protein